jgi:hypothetical protein
MHYLFSNTSTFYNETTIYESSSVSRKMTTGTTTTENLSLPTETSEPHKGLILFILPYIIIFRAETL